MRKRLPLLAGFALAVASGLTLAADPAAEIGEIFMAAELDQAVQRGVGVALLRGASDNTTSRL